MPYRIEERDGKYCVVKETDGKTIHCHETREQAEAQMRAVAAGWAVGVVPELLARGAIADGSVVDLAPGRSLPIQLYWHCWNLESELLDALSSALTSAAAQALVS